MDSSRWNTDPLSGMQGRLENELIQLGHPSLTFQDMAEIGFLVQLTCS